MKLPLLLFYAAGTLAAPFMVLDDNLKTAKVEGLLGNCQSSRFNQGKTYAYDYAGETISKIEGASIQATGIRIKSKVLVTPLSECKFSMSLSNTELLTKSKNQDFSRSQDSSKLQRDLEKYELLFTMNGNKIHTVVAHNMEPTNILNMKRGILSTLQVDQANTQETDVNGVCQSTVVKDSETTMTETKKLSECSERAQNNYGIQAASFKTGDSVQPLDSSSKCVYTMKGDMIKNVECEEEHIFRPFSAGYNSPSGAMTVVKQSMKFVSFVNVPATDLLAADYEKTTTLVFDHTKEGLKYTNALTDTADAIMTSLVSKDSLSAQQNSAHEFTALVMVLRKMNDKAMKPLWDKYFNCLKSKTCTSDEQGVYRQYLLDAIAYCGTSTCVSFVHDVIVDGEIKGERVTMFLQSITLVAETTKDMIRDVLDITKKQPSRQAFLTLGTLLYRHCKKSPTECDFNAKSIVSQAELYLESILRDSCQDQDKHERVEEMIMALKAIGNAKRPLRVRGTLLKCVEKSMHANLTQSALNAFKSMPCGDDLFTEAILKFIKNENIDAEKRIHAFHAAMKCPNEYLFERLVQHLETEPSKQLSSFMSTYMTNILESNNPEHKQCREILEKITKSIPLKEVNLPFYQYSKFFEKTFGVANVGVSTEGKIVFHPDGFLPRTGVLNVKGNFLGKALDLFEAGVHLEGAEECLDDMFGTDGLLSKDFILQIANSSFSLESWKEIYQQRKDATAKRNTKMTGKLDKMHKKVNMKPSKPSAHLFIKVMGQEVRVISYDDLFWLIDEIDNMNVIQLLTDVARGGHKTFTKSLMFLEMSHVVPTGMGLPLKMELTGSSVASIELDGKFDIRNMFWGPGSIHIKGSVKPSAVVEITGKMGIDSVYATSGVFVNSSMFTSNLLKGNIIYEAGKLVKINLDTPEEPIQLFNASSTPYMYMNEKTDLIEGTERKINPDYCVKSKIIGYGLCTSLRVPLAFREYEAPYYPLSGPSHFGVKLVRGDEKLTTYQFLMKMEKKGKEVTGNIEFSTPGAYYDRTVGGKMTFLDTAEEKTLTLSTEKNGKMAQIQASYNPSTKRHFIESKTNFFTPKEVVSRMEVFNTANKVSEQYGMSYTLTYDWYKFEHVTKYVKKDSGYMLHSSTIYYPKKSVVGVLEYITKEKKLVARFDANQLKQAFEFSGQLQKTASGNGVLLTGTHLTSKKSASLFLGYTDEADKKEFRTEITVDGKKASSVMGYYNKAGVKSYEHVVIVNGKSGKFMATLENGQQTKKVEMNLVINGKKMAESSAVVTNTDAEKSLLLSATAAQKTAQTKAGYYVQGKERTVKVEFDIDGRKAEMFFNLQENSYTFGGLAGKYSAGVRGLYRTDSGKKVCMSMYYGTKGSEQEPMTTCVSYESLSTVYTHKRLSFALDLKKIAKTYTMNIDAMKKGKESSLTSTILYNDEQLVNEKIAITYDGLMNTELVYKLTVGKYFGGLNIFTRSKSNNGNFGVEGYYMEKSAMLINRWAVTKLDKATDRSLNTEVVINGKTLPVATTLNLFTEKGAFGPSARLTVGKVSFGYATMINYANGDYSMMDEVVIANNGKSLFKAYRKSALIFNADKKEFSQKFGAVVFDKTYEYGWESAFVNQGTVSKTAFDVIFRLQYSTTRKSVVTFTFANNKKASSVLVNFEYIPTKSLSHSFVFDKKINELNVDIEFLPKMHTKFMARLDTKNGYKFTTDFGLKWKNYNRFVTMVNSFKNNKESFEVSTKFGDVAKFSLTVEKANNKKITIGARVMKTNIKFITTLLKKVVKFNIVKNGKVLANVGLGLNRVGSKWTFSVLKGQTKVFSLSGDYNRFINEMYVSAKSGQKELVGLSGRFDKKQGKLVGSVSYSGKTYFKVIAKKENNIVSLKLVAPTLERDVTFAAQLKRGQKSVVLSVESGKVRFGVEARADWEDKVAFINGFYNKHVAGISLTATKTAITYKMTFTPKVSVQAVFEIIDDRILKMTIFRQSGSKMIEETSMHYKLSRKASQFVLEWNTKYFKKMTQYVTPKVNKIMKEMKKYVNKASSQSKKYVAKTADKMAKAAMDFVDNVDNSFDNFDFVAARDQVGSTAVSGMKKMSELVQTAFEQLIKALKTIKKELPQLRKQLNKITMKTIKYMRTMPKDLQANLKVLNAQLKEVQRVVMIVAENLTESTRPVVNKAIELAKTFKVRGKTMEELSVILKTKGEELIKVYTEQAKEQFEILKKKGQQFYTEGTKKVLKMRIPYRKETVAEVIEIVVAKIEELKLKIKEIDAKKMLDEAKTFVLNYKINGLTPEAHIDNLKITMKNLPAETKKMLLTLIKLVRQYTKEVEIVYGQVAEFAQPMTNYVILVKDSAVKRFGPLYADAVVVLKEQYNTIDMTQVEELAKYFNKNAELIQSTIDEFFTPLLAPMKPLYKNVMKQVRRFQIMGVRVGPMFDMNMEMMSNSIDEYITKSSNMMNEQMETLNNMVDKYTKMTPEDMVEMVFASSADMSEQAMAYITKVYQQRQNYVKQTQQQLEKTYADLQAKYADLKNMWTEFSAQKPENVLKGFYKQAEKRILDVIEEMTSIVNQLAAFDLANPTAKAWEDMDVLGHLNKYGVNKKTSELIKAMKDVKLTKVILNTIEMAKDLYEKLYSQVFVKAVQVYGKVEKAVDYVRSIPKKEYEEWYQELRSFALENKDKFVNFVTSKYAISKEAAVEYYTKMMTLSTDNYNTMKELYNTKAMPVFNRVSKQSQLFYNDVKQPTIDVTTHYKTIATTFANKYYDQYKQVALKHYNELRTKVETQLKNLNNQIQEQYQNFLNKYGDMTWEQVGEEMVKYGETKYALAEQEYNKNFKKVEKLVAEYKQKAEELYNKAKLQYEKYMAKFENEIKPKVIAKYEEIRAKVETLVAEYKVKATEVLDMVKAEALKLQNKGMEIYNAHKDKTFKTIYREIKAIIVKEVKAQYAKATKLYNEKSTEANKMIQQYYKQLNAVIVDKVLPEVSLEMQSIINQTLKNSVVMAEEVVKAYTPHYNLVKRETIKLSKVAVNKMTVVFEQSQVELKKNMVKLEKLIKEFIETLKEHEYTKKAIDTYNNALKHEYVVKAQAEIEKAIKMVQDKVEEIKAHPMTKKYVKIAQKQFIQLKKEIKSLEKKMNKMMKDKRYKDLVKTLKQIKKSMEFTYNKLAKKVTPHVTRARKVAQNQIEVVPVKAQQAFTFFREEPEEAFWTAVKIAKDVVIETYEIIVAVELEMIKELPAQYYEIAKELLVETVDEITDDWTKDTTKQLYKDAVKMTKVAEKKLKSLPGKVHRMAMREYREKLADLKKWYKQTRKTLIQQWKECPYREIFVNQVWGEIVDEIKQHELSEAARDVAKFTAGKATELKELTIKEFNKQKAIVEKKMKELKAIALEKYEELKVKAEKTYTTAVAEYNKMVAKVDNFLETTTIADVVEFVQQKVEELKVKAQELKVKALEAKAELEKLAKKNMEKAEKLMKEYKLKAEAMYEDALVKASAYYKKNIEPKVNEYKDKAMALYKKHYPQLEAKYLELKEKALENYELYMNKGKKLTYAYKVKAVELYKKTKSDAYNKWMESEVRAKLITLKGMTIKETIEALKKLPKQTEVFVKAKYAEYSAKAVAEFNQRYADLIKEIEMRRDQVIELAKPYYVPALRVYKLVENEIVETAVFVYRYHRIAERSSQLKSFVTSEYERLVPIVKANMKQMAEDMKVKAQEYKFKGQKLAYDALATAGDKTLRGIHSGMRYVDSIDMSKYQKQARVYFTELNRYIAFDEGKITITIPHGEVKPSISHHVKKVGKYAERTIKNAKQEGKKMLEKVQRELKKIQARTEELREQLTKAVLDNTVEIREDMARSYGINKKIAQRVYEKATIIGQKTYKKAMVQYKDLQSKAKVWISKAKQVSKKYYKQLVEVSNKVYLKSSEIFMDIYGAGIFKMHKRAYFHADKYYTLAKKEITGLVKEHKPTVMKMYKKYTAMVKAEGKKMQKSLMPYYLALEKAYKDVRMGVPAEKALKPIIRQITFVSREYQRQAIKQLSNAKSTFCRTDAKLCKHLKESSRVHQKIFNKYFERLVDMATAAKAQMDRNIRKMSKYTTRPFFNDYNVVASMFGDHVLTFDKKYFQMMESKTDCSYLLAHDFMDNQFTIKTEGDNIIVNTPEMDVTIKKNGIVKALVNGEVVKTLPVQSKSGHCIRKDSLIICHVKSSFKIVVDLENDITTLSVSGWYYGKTQGIFGTFNRESFDDWKLPEGKITNDIYNFMNSYELSGKGKCQLKAADVKTKECKQFPSRKCAQLFNEASSPYTKYFETVNPEPFWKACIHDTTPCQKKVKTNDYCKSVSAFVNVARAMGQWIDYPTECSSFDNYKVGEEFKQKPMKKALDVVILVSQKESQAKYMESFTDFLQNLHRMLKNKKKMIVRYAVIGFGGAGVSEEAHVKSFSKEAFGNLKETLSVLKNLKHDGQVEDSNDAFMAISEGANLPFRAGSSKLFVLFNGDKQSAHKLGATLDEAKYALTKEIEGTLIVFNDVTFKQKHGGKVLGQSTRNLYTNKKTIPGKFELPTSDYKQLVEDTDGGHFDKNLSNGDKVAKAAYDITSQKIIKNNEHCKLCRVEASRIDGTTKVSCQSQKELRC